MSLATTPLMAMMGYPARSEHVYFDIVRDGYQGQMLANIGIALIIVGVAWLTVVIVLDLKNKADKIFNLWEAKKIRPMVLIVFSIAWSFMVFITTYLPYRSLRSKLISNQCNVAEGQVKSFHPAREQRGETRESFKIGDMYFSYDYASSGPGFHQTNPEGGPIHEGVNVKLYYFNDQIAKLILF